MEFDLQQSEIEIGMTDDSVEQMLILAERLREANGGELDESAILAVAEATGAPLEYVRLAVQIRSEKQKKSFLANIRSQYLTLEQHTRRYVLSGAAAGSAALLLTADEWNAVHTRYSQGANYGIFTMLATLCGLFGLYNVFKARDLRTAGISGGLLMGGLYLMHAVFEFLLGVPSRVDSGWFLPMIVLGAAGGVGVHQLGNKYRVKLGLKDPLKERQDLLKQLNRLQDKLSSGLQFMTFLSIDIVGSTRMKEVADPLAVEYTFTEYHEFVTRIVQKYGGRLHSTAGDGMICAFDHPQHAFSAAKNIQASLIELNMLRNRIGVPIVLRCGIHSGQVMAPEGGDVKSVNFSHVIDVAAHLQKEAPAGGIAVSDSAASQIIGGPAAIGQQRVEAVDVKAVVWMPKSAPSAPPMNMGLPSTLPEQA